MYGKNNVSLLLVVEDALKLVDWSYLFQKNLFFTVVSNDVNSRKMNLAGNCFCLFWMPLHIWWLLLCTVSWDWYEVIFLEVLLLRLQINTDVVVCMYSGTWVVLLKSVGKILTPLLSVLKLPLMLVRPSWPHFSVEQFCRRGRKLFWVYLLFFSLNWG